MRVIVMPEPRPQPAPPVLTASQTPGPEPVAVLRFAVPENGWERKFDGSEKLNTAVPPVMKSAPVSPEFVSMSRPVTMNWLPPFGARNNTKMSVKGKMEKQKGPDA
jgi:hypothetical protein